MTTQVLLYVFGAFSAATLALWVVRLNQPGIKSSSVTSSD